jgi:alginate O-acetyltransferase complex protein AlgJ
LTVPRWGFEALLRAALKSPLTNVSEKGQGPFEPMAAYRASLAEPLPKLVIWEIPERYLDDAPKAVQN